MLAYLASDPLPYAPHSLEDAQNGLIGLILLLLAVALFGKSNGRKAQAKPPVRRKAGNLSGIALAIAALVFIGRSSDGPDSTPAPTPKPTHTVTTPSHKAEPNPGSTHCSLICFHPKN